MAQFTGTSATSSPAVSQHSSLPQQQTRQQSQAPQQQQQSGAGAHKRVYQACIPCRRRKVRCDLGSVDNPNDPPCVRCRRESKDCFFSATRRKRKTEDDGSDGDDYTVRNGRKRILQDEESISTPPQIDRRLYSEVPLTPGGSHGRSQPLRRPGGDSEEADPSVAGSKRARKDSDLPHGHDDNEHMENPDAQTVMRRGVYGPHDALDLLYKAATDTDRLVQPTQTPTPRMDHHHQLANDSITNSPMNMARTREESRASIATVQPALSAVDSHIHRVAPQFNPSPGRLEQAIDPELGRQDPSAHPGYAEAIKAWTRFRFVRAGWFTPHEAIEYID